MATVLELRESRAQVWERMKALIDGAEGENRNLSAEEEANWNAANGDISDLDKRIARQEALERKPAVRQEKLTPAVLTNTEAVRATAEYKAAFRRWLMDDTEPEDRGLIRAGMRALQTNVPNAMGLAVPESMESGIEKALLAFGGMREAATVRRTSDGGDLVFLTGNDTSNTGELLAEGAATSEQDATVGAVTLKAFTYSSKMIRVSLQLMQDASFDVESYIAGLLAERVGRITNTHFTTGVGADRPRGIVNVAAAGITAASTTAVTWDELINLEHSVGSAYRRGARFMFADATLLALRKLKDGEGRYLWQPGAPQGGVPNMIGQYPYTINDDMATMAASAKAILFGQLSRYIIRDVTGWTLMRFNEKYGEYLQVAFTGFSRHDGNLIDAGSNPVKLITMAA